MGEQAIRAIITGNQLIGEHTEYMVELRAGPATLSTVKRRFREFTELHAQLERHQHPFEIPPIPPKKFFGKTNPQFVLKRQNELQTFLDKLVERIVAQPKKAQAAWKLVCLFLALDPKQYVPESVLHDNGGAASNPPLSVGSVNFESQSVLVDHHESEVTLLDAEEIKRMEEIVDNFARKVINISRVNEERLQAMPPQYLSSKLDLNKLGADLSKHIGDFDLNSIESQPSQYHENPAITGANDFVVSLDTPNNNP